MADHSSEPNMMVPHLQLAIRLLAAPSDDVFATVATWREQHPGAITDLAPGEDAPVGEEEQARFEEAGVPIWRPLATPPLPAATPRPDVWVFGNPPQARANPDATPRVKTGSPCTAAGGREASWLVHALRQRMKSYEAVIAAMVALQPQIAIALEPDKLPGIPRRAIAERVGFHESTVGRVATACRYQTIHGVVQLVLAGSSVRHRALW